MESGALGDAQAAADAVAATLRVAAALAVANRTIDLCGLDNEIGRLCAALLDLPAASGRAMRPRLLNLLAELDQLAAVMPRP